MIQSWFSQEIAFGFILFSLLSLLAGLSVNIEQERQRVVVTAAMVVGATTSFIGLAVVPAFGRQPGYILVALSVPAVALSVVFLAVLLSLPSRYSAAVLWRNAVPT